jgi:hypothetical protein
MAKPFSPAARRRYDAVGLGIRSAHINFFEGFCGPSTALH